MQRQTYQAELLTEQSSPHINHTFDTVLSLTNEAIGVGLSSH